MFSWLLPFAVEHSPFMATQRQIEANRRNAQKSTGPGSVEGRAVSRCNAVKTGIYAKSTIIPGEDPAQLEALGADCHRQFRPATPLARFLVDSLVGAEWQLRRFREEDIIEISRKRMRGLRSASILISSENHTSWRAARTPLDGSL
jgi:hypothetical protein